MFDSNSKNRFHTSTDNCGVNPPDDRTRSNNTRVLLSSANENEQNLSKMKKHRNNRPQRVTIQMRQIFDVTHDELGTATESFQAQLKDAKCNVLVLAAIVFH